jgi:hypothetical protein
MNVGPISKVEVQVQDRADANRDEGPISAIEARDRNARPKAFDASPDVCMAPNEKRRREANARRRVASELHRPMTYFTGTCQPYRFLYSVKTASSGALWRG